MDNILEALSYINDNRRVVSTQTPYYNKDGELVTIEEGQKVYFLDISVIYEIEGKEYLSVCDEDECNSNGRLQQSQNFMNNLVDKIYDFAKLMPSLSLFLILLRTSFLNRAVNTGS